MQRLATVVEDVRRWLDERLEQKETVAEKIEPAESVKPPRTVREALRQPHVHRQQQRRSGGIHI